MDLTNAKVGDVIKIYVDDDFAIVHGRSIYKHTLRATVLLISHGTVLLAWSQHDGICPVGAKPIKLKLNGVDFTMGSWVPTTLVIAEYTSRGAQSGTTSGHKCTGPCAQDYPYASHDLSTGPFVCKGCRMLQQWATSD